MLHLEHVRRRFTAGGVVAALDDVSITIEAGEFVAIVGPSGGGKSTLLNTLGLLDTPTSGSYRIHDTDVGTLPERERARLRANTFGFVFQNFHLLEDRPVIDSVELGMLYNGTPSRARRARAIQALQRVGLAGSAAKRASTLSGGQRQRVAVARALAADSSVVIADEPTGNLDSRNAAQIMGHLRALQYLGRTVVLVTHDLDLARTADRIIHLRDGAVVRVEGGPGRRTSRDAGVLANDMLASRSGVASGSMRHRVSDTVLDAVHGLRARPSRTVGLVAAVATAVALAVATIGVSATAAAQVSAQFDARTNRDVAVIRNDHLPSAESVPSAGKALLDAAAEVVGVESASVLYERGSAAVLATPARPARTAPVATFRGALTAAARLSIRWVPHRAHRLEAGGVLVGGAVARQLQLGPLPAHPSVNINGHDIAVAGVVTRSPRLPELLGSVIASDSAQLALPAPSRGTLLLRTDSGAAQQVARQVPHVIDPYQPDALTVDAPVDPTTLRDAVQTDVAATLYAFTAIALAAAVLALGNAMMAAISHRRSEFGLRRALGARSRQLAVLVMSESAIIGIFGGAAGLLLGLVAVTIMTIVRHWGPVFEPSAGPAALIGGTVIGVLGGLVPAWRATRIEPQAALRS